MKDYQRYIHELEALHGWLKLDLVHNCFLMGEEVGEVFKAVRRHEKLDSQEVQAPARDYRSSPCLHMAVTTAS